MEVGLNEKEFFAGRVFDICCFDPFISKNHPIRRYIATLCRHLENESNLGAIYLMTMTLSDKTRQKMRRREIELLISSSCAGRIPRYKIEGSRKVPKRRGWCSLLTFVTLQEKSLRRLSFAT